MIRNFFGRMGLLPEKKGHKSIALDIGTEYEGGVFGAD